MERPRLRFAFRSAGRRRAAARAFGNKETGGGGGVYDYSRAGIELEGEWSRKAGVLYNWGGTQRGLV